MDTRVMAISTGMWGIHRKSMKKLACQWRNQVASISGLKVMTFFNLSQFSIMWVYIIAKLRNANGTKIRPMGLK